MTSHVTNQSRQPQLETTAPVRDPHPFKTFYEGFNKEERKQFMNNMLYHFTHIINRDLRKMKEASRRFKESIRR